MTLLLKEEITFPRWDGDPEFDPYGTYKELVLALKYGRSLDAAERAADDEELLVAQNSLGPVCPVPLTHIIPYTASQIILRKGMLAGSLGGGALRCWRSGLLAPGAV